LFPLNWKTADAFTTIRSGLIGVELEKYLFRKHPLPHIDRGAVLAVLTVLNAKKNGLRTVFAVGE